MPAVHSVEFARAFTTLCMHAHGCTNCFSHALAQACTPAHMQAHKHARTHAQAMDARCRSPNLHIMFKTDYGRHAVQVDEPSKVPNLRRDSPASPPGLAHICAGTRPHLRRGLQGGSSTIVLPGFNDTKKLFMQMKRRGVHACRQCTLVHLHPRVCAHVHTCTHASTHARTMCAHA